MAVQHISATEFIDARNNQTLIAIDLRTPAEISSEYITNTIALPLHKLSENSLEEVLTTPDHNDSGIYLLCQTGKRAELAAKKLKSYTRNTLVIVDGGLNAIKTAGGDILYSENKTMSIERQVRIAAGLLVLIGVVLGYVVAPPLFLVSGFVGAGLMFAGITDTCTMGMLLMRMPWNQSSSCTMKT